MAFEFDSLLHCVLCLCVFHKPTAFGVGVWHFSLTCTISPHRIKFVFCCHVTSLLHCVLCLCVSQHNPTQPNTTNSGRPSVHRTVLPWWQQQPQPTPFVAGQRASWCGPISSRWHLMVPALGGCFGWFRGHHWLLAAQQNPIHPRRPEAIGHPRHRLRHLLLLWRLQADA